MLCRIHYGEGKMTKRDDINHISLRRVSELAGVTQCTASRILNKKPGYNYADATIRRVFETARECGYRTNQLYRSVFTGKTKSAGLITAPGTFYSEISLGIHDRLLTDDFAILLGLNCNDFDTPSASIEEKIITRLNAHRVDGFIIRPTLDDATDKHFQEIIDLELPLITIDREVVSNYADHAGSDNVEGGRMAARYLSDLGHSNIVQFVIQQQCTTFRNRALGFESELLERGCLVQTATGANLEEIKHKCRLIFSRPKRPTAIFCGNDTQALVIYTELEKLNLRIPDDVSIIGFGNEECGKLIKPGLTTIDQNPYLIGKSAAELFLQRIEEVCKPDRKRQVCYIALKLVERNSCQRAFPG